MAETTVTTVAPGSIIYPSDPNYPKDLISGWTSGDLDAGHELDMNYEPVMSPLYLEQFYKYYSTAGHRLYKKDPDKVFDYSMFANKTVTIENGAYTVYALNGDFFNEVVRNIPDIPLEEGAAWSIVYNVGDVFYSINERSDEYLFCRKGKIGSDSIVAFYGVMFKDGKYTRINNIILELTRNNGNVTELKFSTVDAGEVKVCFEVDNLNEPFVNVISTKTFVLSEMDGFLDLESQLWVKLQSGGNEIVRRTYYDGVNHCYIEIANDMDFVNSFMSSTTNKNALIKTRDEFNDESFAIIPFTQWYRSGGYKVPAPGQV